MSGDTSFFDSRAATWEERCYPPPARKRLAELTSLFGARRREHVLDIGAGTGVLAPYLREAVGKEGFILSIDLSLPMLQEAAKKTAYHLVERRGGLAQATAMALPLKTGSIDRVVCFAAFPHFSDKSLALAEMSRVLRPGGGFVIAHLMSREELSRHHGGHDAVAEDRLPDARIMTGLFRRAGFSPPEIVDIPGQYLATATKRK